MPEARTADIVTADQTEWTPRREGDLYCSPRCGYHCTWAAFERAVREASELCARLGQGWKPHVFEDGGWHYKACRGVARVHALTRGDVLGGGWVIVGYWCLINSDKQFTCSAETPEAALAGALQAARAHAAKIQADLSVLLAPTADWEAVADVPA